MTGPERPDTDSSAERFEAHAWDLPWRKFMFVAPAVLLMAVLYLVRLPYFVITPGPADDVVPLIRIQNHQTYPPDGHLLLTSVSFYQPNAYEALWAWIDKTESVVPESALLAPGESQEQGIQRGLSEMDTSKIDAAVVALTKYAGYPESHGEGVLVESVLPGSPAAGKLFTGDVILSVDGEAIRDPDQLGTIIRAAGVGGALTFEIRAGGKTSRVRVVPGRIKGLDHPAIGIGSVANFPFPLDIQSGDIGGPSAGLMWTLGLVEVLTPGDLTGGRVVAGTGTIDIEGSVGPIGGITEKVVAAERAGAAVFFAPAPEAGEARAVAKRMRIVPVKTYLDAVRYLQEHGGSL